MDGEMKDKVVLVTGATNGIGLETARVLAGQGATVIGVGRNPEKCAEVAAHLAATTGNRQVEFLVADLSVQAQVRQLAETFQRKYDRLDALINNAGAFFVRREESADGIELTLALNHLNYFLLTDQLLEILKRSGPARIVNVSSEAHRGASINFDDIEFKRSYAGWTAYGQSKLANVLFTYELARRLDGTQVTANALHPGFVATGFGHNNGGLMRMGLQVVQKVVAKRPQQGAETSIYLASSPDVAGVTGQYFDDKKIVKSSAASYDTQTAARLWELSEVMVREHAMA